MIYLRRAVLCTRRSCRVSSAWRVVVIVVAAIRHSAIYVVIYGVFAECVNERYCKCVCLVCLRRRNRNNESVRVCVCVESMRAFRYGGVCVCVGKKNSAPI